MLFRSALSDSFRAVPLMGLRFSEGAALHLSDTLIRDVFRMSVEKAEMTAQMAQNQGLYNGFLAAGLIWALIAGVEHAPFFLICVAVAGIYGAITVQKTILYVQTIPAALALAAYYLGL